MTLIDSARDAVRSGFIEAARVHDLSARYNVPCAELTKELVPIAQDLALAPLSGFRVGAVAQGLSGHLYLGANIEVAAGPMAFSIHAEQAAVVNALSYGESGLVRLAVSAAPCGHCRQFLYELDDGGDLEIQLPDRPAIRLESLLPQAFGPADLGLAGGLGGRKNPARPPKPAGTDLFTAAIAASGRSYAPYSGSAAGIAVRLANGTLSSGFAIENAAYNPSLLPIQVALCMTVLAGESMETATEAVLVEEPDAVLSHIEPTDLILQRIAPSCRLTVRKVAPERA